MTTCVSPVTHGDARSTTTPPNGKSAWSKSGRKSPAPCVPSPAPNTSATYGPTSPPPPNTASISSRHSSNSHPAGRGYPTSTDLISYANPNYAPKRVNPESAWNTALVINSWASQYAECFGDLGRRSIDGY